MWNFSPKFAPTCLASVVRSATLETEEISLHLGIDRKASGGFVEASLIANSGSPLAKQLVEAGQVMMERRKGGETGVKAVQYLEGKAAWEAAKAGKWDRTLLDAALARVSVRGKGKVEEDDTEPIVYLIEYRDGLQAAAYLSPRHCEEFAFAGRAKSKSAPLACWYELPKPQRDHFSFQAQAVAQMMVTGKPTYPVERTLLTTGMVDALLESRLKGQQRVETPELGVRYTIQ